MAKPEMVILIPRRTSRQGTALNEGKFTPRYVEETSTLQMNPDDMARLGLKGGDLSSRLTCGETHGTGMPNSKGIDVEGEKV